MSLGALTHNIKNSFLRKYLTLFKIKILNLTWGTYISVVNRLFENIIITP